MGEEMIEEIPFDVAEWGDHEVPPLHDDELEQVAREPDVLPGLQEKAATKVAVLIVG